MKLRNALLPWLLAAALGGATAAADDALDADWSTRLLQQKALAERAQQRLDECSVAYAKAVAGGAAEDEVRAKRAARDAAAAEVAALEEALPEMVRAAREAGVSEAVLQPYRYAAGANAENESPAATP